MSIDLSQIDGVRDLPPDSLARLEMLSRPRTFRTGSALLQQGIVSDCLYIILAGYVRIERSHPSFAEPLVLAAFGPGAIVGALGLLTSEPAPITVIAVEEVEAVALSYAAVALTMLQYPEAVAALQRCSDWCHLLSQDGDPAPSRAGELAHQGLTGHGRAGRPFIDFDEDGR